MKSGYFKIFAAACLVVFIAARCLAADTNSSSTNADAVANGYLQIQAQLHDTQLALEKSREEAQQNAADTAARIQALEQTLATQRANDLAIAQKNQQSLFMLAGAFGLTVLAAVLFMAWLQWRSVARLVEIASRPGAALASAGAVQQLAAPGRATVEVSNARLLDIVGQLEKKILDLESGGRLLAARRRNPPARSPRDRHFWTRTKPSGHWIVLKNSCPRSRKTRRRWSKRRRRWKSWAAWTRRWRIATAPSRRAARGSRRICTRADCSTGCAVTRRRWAATSRRCGRRTTRIYDLRLMI